MISLAFNCKEEEVHSSLIPFSKEIILDGKFDERDITETNYQKLPLFANTKIFNVSEIEENYTRGLKESSVKDLSKSKPIMKGLTPTPNDKSKYVYSFQSLQKWEGVVEEIYEDAFLARLTDLTFGGADEEVELSLSEITSEDIKLLKVGAIFYWSIGHELAKGQMKKTSFIRFRRLPAWNSKQMNRALDFTIKYKNIKWD